METQFEKGAVDYCAKLFPQYSRQELERRIRLGQQVAKDKLSDVGIETPLTPEEMGFYSVYQYYKLWVEATPTERAAIPENVKLEAEPDDEEFEEMMERLERIGYNLPEEDHDAPDELN